jgi:hypothetical protein
MEMSIYKLQVGDLVQKNESREYGIVIETVKYSNQCYIVWTETGEKVKSRRNMNGIRRFSVISETNV